MFRTFGSLIMIAVSSVSAFAAPCGSESKGKYNGKNVYQLDGGIFFESQKLQVDADGAPNSYLVNGKGLSFTCDGVTANGSTPDTDPNWQEKCVAGWKLARETGDYSKMRIFGFLAGKNNVPVIQGPGDPLPGTAYISTTSVNVPDAPVNSQRNFVDATKIPYVVLSAGFTRKFGVGPGDLVVVYRPSSGSFAYGVYGDGGKLGEASVKMHQAIGNNPMINRNGVERAKRGLAEATWTLVFPGEATTRTADTDAWLGQIASKGKTVFDQWGGVSRLRVCAGR